MSDSLMGGDVDGSTSVEGNTSGVEEGAGGTDVNTAESGAVENPSGPEWLSGFEGVDPDVAGDTSLKAIKDIPSLVKSYVHAQRKMGADKVVLPNKNSTNEEWLSFYHKLGLPTEFTEYDVQPGEESVVGDDFLSEFKKTAYENNMLPGQAQAMFNFINSQARVQNERLQQQSQEAVNAELNALKEEWGEAWDKNLHKAKVAVNEFGGEDLKSYLNESGLGNDPQLIKAFAKIGNEFLKEDNFEGQSKPAYAMSPSEAQEKANNIMGDFEGPYYNAQHPDHKRTVDEVNKLFQVMSSKGA